MKKEIVNYMRRKDYKSFKKAVLAGMTYDDYIQLFGQTIIQMPVNRTGIGVFINSIYASDIRWVNLISTKYLVELLMGYGYQEELDEYLMGQEYYLQVYYRYAENYPLNSEGTIFRLMELMIDYHSNIRSKVGIEDIHVLFKYKFLHHYTKNLTFETSSRANRMYVQWGQYLRQFSVELQEEYAQQYQEAQDIHKGIRRQYSWLNVKENKEQQRVKELRERQLDCQYCTFNDHRVENNYTVGEQRHVYRLEEDEDGQNVLLLTCQDKGVTVTLTAKFCIHCGRDIEGPYNQVDY